MGTFVSYSTLPSSTFATMSTDHDHGATRDVRSRVLWIVLVANGGFLFAEVVGGVVFNSLALLADSAHMLSDVFALAIALAAQRLMLRPASARHTFGFQRAEVLGAQINGLTLVAAAAWIFFEAARRIGEPPEVEAGGMLVVAFLGLLVNAGSALLIGRARGRSLNMRGVYLHMLVDAAGSVGAIAAGLAVAFWGAAWADPVISVVIGLLVLWSALRLLKETTHVLLEGAPRGMDVGEVERALLTDSSVDSIHDLHLWNLASDVPAMSAHVVMTSEASLHNAQIEGARLKKVLHDRFGIDHSTLELECHECTSRTDGRVDST